VEEPLEPTAQYQARQAEYLDRCFGAGAPGEGGGLYAQVCRVARGGAVDPEPLEAALDHVEARLDVSDFKVAAFVRMLYLDRRGPPLAEEVRAALEQSVLGFKYWLDEPGKDQMAFWTENHQALYHSSELLAGQLYPDASFGNDGKTGREHAEHAEPRIERWLELRGRFGFSEWHSNVYLNEDVPALVNLADFAESEAVRTKAQAVLDLVALDLLTNTFDGHYATVHGRTYPNKLIGGLRDSTREAAWVMLGLGDVRSAGNFSASFLATSDAYAPPALLEELAAHVAGGVEHRQRDGFDVADGARWGIGYESHDDVVVWAGMAALVAPEVVEGTVAMLDDLDLWDGFLFGDLPPVLRSMLQGMAEQGTVRDLAIEVEPISRGIALEAMDTYVYRTAHYQIAGAQDYNPGFWGLQTHMWQATLDGDAYVFTTCPSTAEGVDMGTTFAGPWIGSWLPRLTLHDNVGVVQYRREPLPAADAFLTSRGPHAYFPRSGFDEVRQEAGWTVGRKGDAWLGLWSRLPTRWADDNDYELICDAEENVWVIELGSADEQSSFEAFVAGLVAAEVEVGAEGAVRFVSPSVGLVEVGWEGPMTVDGERVDLGPYARWDNAWATQPVGGWVARVEHGGRRLELDFETPARRLLRLP